MTSFVSKLHDSVDFTPRLILAKGFLRKEKSEGEPTNPGCRGKRPLNKVCGGCGGSVLAGHWHSH